MTNPTVLCLTCPALRPRSKPRRPESMRVCARCRERLSGHLRALPGLLDGIDTQPGRAAGERRAVGYESRAPLNITALSLLGPGGDTPKALLDLWAMDWAAALAQAVPHPQIASTCKWLDANLDWACDNHPRIEAFALDIHDLHGQIKAFYGTDNGEHVGHCPRTIGDTRCNTPLYVDPYVDRIECARCHTVWRRKAGEWLHLRAQQLDAGVEAA